MCQSQVGKNMLTRCDRWIPSRYQISQVNLHSLIISVAGGHEGGWWFILKCFCILFVGFTLIAIIGKRFEEHL